MALLIILVVNALPRDRPPTPAELRAIPDFALRYPGAVETTRSDRLGVYAAFNDQLTVARTTHRSRDTADAVEAWYSIELEAHGWVRQPDFRSTGPSTPTSFCRWCHPTIDADMWLGINGEEEDSVLVHRPPREPVAAKNRGLCSRLSAVSRRRRFKGGWSASRTKRPPALPSFPRWSASRTKRPPTWSPFVRWSASRTKRPPTWFPFVRWSASRTKRASGVTRD